MKEPHEKGVAIRSAPSFALGTAKCPVKRNRGKDGLGIELRKFAIRAPTPSPLRKATRPAALSRGTGRPCVVVDPMHVWKLYAREPGDLGDA